MAQMNTRDFLKIYGYEEDVELIKKLDFIRNHKETVEIDSVLEIDPNQPGKCYGGIIDDYFFFRLLFEESAKIIEMRKYIENVQRTTKKHTIILEGYSGSGKSTFINYLAYEAHNNLIMNEYNYYTFDMDTNNGDGKRNSIEKDRFVLDLFQRRLKELYENDYLQCCFEKIRDVDDFQALFTRGTFDDLIRYSFFDNQDFPEIKQMNFNKMIRDMNFEDLFAFLMLTIIFNEYDNQENKYNNKYLICFDNLDKQFSPKLFDSLITSVTECFSKIQHIINYHYKDNLNLVYYIDSCIKFCFCVREANINKCHHMLQRINRNSYNMKFFGIYSDNDEDEIIGEILLSRLRLYNFITDKRSEFYCFLEEIAKDKTMMFRICQVFNYNYREVCAFFTSLYTYNTEHNKKYLNEIVIPYRQLRRQFSENRQFASRGIIFNYLIKYLSKHMKLSKIIRYNYVDPNTGENKLMINPFRKIITYILNENFEGNDYHYSCSESRNSNISVNDIYSKFNNIFPKQIVDKTLEFLFQMHDEENWCNFISFRAIEPDIDIEKSLIQVKSTKNDNKSLSDIKLIPNPSCYAYLRFISSHYEWFLCRSDLRESIFSHVYTKTYTRQLEMIILYVFTEASNCAEVLHNQYIYALKKYSGDEVLDRVKNYLRDNTTFKHTSTDTEEEQPRKYGYFHSMRVIDSHVSYLEALADILKEEKKLTAKLQIFIYSTVKNYLHLAFRNFDFLFKAEEGEEDDSRYFHLLQDNNKKYIDGNDDFSKYLNGVRNRYLNKYRFIDSVLNAKELA